MSARNLQSKPHRIGEQCWWYEEMDGIHMYLADTPNGIGTRNVTIPVGEIRAYLKRRDSRDGEKAVPSKRRKRKESVKGELR